MITSVRLKNFKAWQDTGEVRFGKLTGFFGTNSSGKSSIHQMLLLLKQTTESSDRNIVLRTEGDNGGLVNLGTIPELMYAGETDSDEKSMELHLSWKLPKPLKINVAEDYPNLPLESGKPEIKALQFFTKIVHKRVASARVDSFEYRTDDAEPYLLRAGISSSSSAKYQALVQINGKEAERRRGAPSKSIAPIKCYAFGPEVLRSFQRASYLDDVVLEFEQLFQRVYYLGPLREYPLRTYSWGGERPANVGVKGELAVPALLAAARDKLKVKGKERKNRKVLFQEKIQYWLNTMGMVSSFQTKPVREGGTQYELRVRVSKNSKEVLIADVGFGISQVLPVLVMCYYCPEGSTIILEQPEIHLHPAAQSALADVLVDAIQTRGVQILFESHSEHLLRRLQLRIAEGELSADDTVLYFCSTDNETRESTITSLQVDNGGNIINWPRDFFGDLTGDLIKMAETNIAKVNQE
jgi:predicted ATPase